MGDIQQMFYCFKVDENHRDFLRFLGYENNDFTKPLIEYRMCAHVFGNRPSLAIATYGLRKTAKISKESYSKNALYVSNYGEIINNRKWQIYPKIASFQDHHLPMLALILLGLGPFKREKPVVEQQTQNAGPLSSLA